MEQDRQYMVSVVTPFHNVDMKMFRQAEKSIRNQTIGFDNIQWIIVLHNCTEEYLPLLQQMFENDKNVILRELNNGQCTPSSPRNEGTRLATAKYIAYLDGDDSYTPNCFEVCIREAEDTQSQAVWFRRETEKESPELGMQVIGTRWNQLRKRIVVERDNWDDDKMFYGQFGYATSFMFDLDFLRRNKLSFSEEILFGEDFLFIVEVCAASQRICYLPQHIGYHYYVNARSLVQNPNKSPDVLIRYAEGLKQLFDTMEKYGIDNDNTIQGMMECLVFFVLNSPDLTVGHRQKIKDILYKYIIKMSPLPYPDDPDFEGRATRLAVAYDVLLNPENPCAIYKYLFTNGFDTLMKILRRNAKTDYGEQYHFERLKSSQAFCNRVPLSDANSYKPLVTLQTNIGVENILTSQPVCSYWRDEAGTLFPCTQAHIDSYTAHIAETLQTGKTFFVAISHPVISTTIAMATVDTMESSIVKNYFSKCYFANGRINADLTSNANSFFGQNLCKEDYAYLLPDALMAKDLKQIVALSTRQVATALDTLEQKWQKLVHLIDDRKRRDEVTGILSAGFGPSVLKKLWPEMEQIVAFGEGEMYEYTTKVKRYADGIAMNNGYYYTEEAILGKAVDGSNGLFECLKDNVFFELLPIDQYLHIGDNDRKNAKTMLWTEAETGKPYYLVVTTNAGLYRYITSHIIVPQAVSLESIQFTIY